MKHTVALKQSHEFRRLYAKGKSAAALPGGLLPENRTGGNRLGLTVGKKGGGRRWCATKVRRRIREIYRTNEGRINPAMTSWWWRGSVRSLPLCQAGGLLSQADGQAGLAPGEEEAREARVLLSLIDFTEVCVTWAAALLPFYPHLLGLHALGGGKIGACKGGWLSGVSSNVSPFTGRSPSNTTRSLRATKKWRPNGYLVLRTHALCGC